MIQPLFQPGFRRAEFRARRDFDVGRRRLLQDQAREQDESGKAHHGTEDSLCPGCVQHPQTDCGEDLRRDPAAMMQGMRQCRDIEPEGPDRLDDRLIAIHLERLGHVGIGVQGVAGVDVIG